MQQRRNSKHKSEIDTAPPLMIPPSPLGLYGLYSSIVLATLNICLPNFVLSRVASTNNRQYYVFYTIIALLALVSLLLLSIPSFKKSRYPNLLGLIGLVITLFVLYSTITAMLAILSLSMSR